MSADAAMSAFAMLWVAGWAAYAAVKVDAALRPGADRVGCNGAAGSNGRTVCISTLGVGLEALCVCSKTSGRPRERCPRGRPDRFPYGEQELSGQLS